MNSEASSAWEQYRQGLEYQRSMKFTSNWPMYERFRAGDQWPAVTEKTRNLPRPVLNIIEQIERHKISSVMAEQIKLIYQPQDATLDESESEGMTELADKTTTFAEKCWENIKQDRLSEEMLEDASNRGTGIIHYYFDNSKMGGAKGHKYIGEVAGEIVDPINFFVGNPNILSLQKQPYIIISSRESVADMRKLARQSKVPEDQIALIQPDSDTESEGYDSAKQEMKGDEKVTVLTKYWKENGQVCFAKSTQNAVIQSKIETGLKLYPLVLMQWKKRKKCLYGQGDAEQLIANQKAINLLYALQLLSIQLTAFPKMLAKPGSLKQAITNQIGEIIYDNTPPGAGDGIKYMQPAYIPSSVRDFTENFMLTTKDVAGASEHSLGETKTSDLNATAISLLQKAAGIPLESIKRNFYSAIEDIGRVWLDMFRVYYNTPRLFAYEDEDNNEQVDEFNGSSLEDINMSLKVDVGASTIWNEGNSVEMLGNLFEKQIIDEEQYVKFVPKNLIPAKDQILKALRERKEGEVEQAYNDEQFNTQKLINMMSPEEKAAFFNASEDEQMQILREMQEAQEPIQ